MHFARRFINKNFIKNILIIILVIFEITIATSFHHKCNKLQNANSELKSTVNNQINIIKDLNAQNDDLNNRVLQLEEANNLLTEEKNKLLDDKANLEWELSSLKAEQQTMPQTNYKDFKSYMSYKAITNRSSKQYALQQQAATNENGFRCIDGRPLVAIGTGWGLSVGDRAVVYCDGGNSFEVVVGDIKADKHTLDDNKTTASNNCRCEFIVDMGSLNSTVKRRGNVSVLTEYSGYVVDIK